MTSPKDYLTDREKEFDEKYLNEAERMFSDWENNGHEWNDRPYTEVLEIIESNLKEMREIKSFLTQSIEQSMEVGREKAIDKVFDWIWAGWNLDLSKIDKAKEQYKNKLKSLSPKP